ncbi:hypothetical protein ACVXG9_19425 [Escherichia coli]
MSTSIIIICWAAWRCNHVDSEECHRSAVTPAKVQEAVDIAIENDVIVAIGDARRNATPMPATKRCMVGL